MAKKKHNDEIDNDFGTDLEKDEIGFEEIYKSLGGKDWENWELNK